MSRNLILLIVAGALGVILLVFAMNRLFLSPGHESAGAEQAMAMVSRAVEHMNKHGAAALIEKVNAGAPEFHEGELYVFVMDEAGTIMAHPIDSGLVGKGDQTVRDGDGNVFLARMAAAAADNPDGSWFDYRWPHPVTGTVSEKSSWIVMRDGHVIGVGIYSEDN